MRRVSPTLEAMLLLAPESCIKAQSGTSLSSISRASITVPSPSRLRTHKKIWPLASTQIDPEMPQLFLRASKDAISCTDKDHLQQCCKVLRVRTLSRRPWRGSVRRLKIRNGWWVERQNARSGISMRLGVFFGWAASLIDLGTWRLHQDRGKATLHHLA